MSASWLRWNDNSTTWLTGKCSTSTIRSGAKLKDDAKKKWEELRAELKKFDDLKPAPLPIGYAVADVGPIAPPTVIPGDKSETDIAPGLLSVLDDSPAKISPTPNAPQSTGRRTALARWLTALTIRSRRV